MKLKLLAGACALALLAGCAALQQYEPAANAALNGFEAVNNDVVQLEQQVSANGAAMTPQELVAFQDAQAAIGNAISTVTGDQSKAAAEFSKVTTALDALVPFVPEIASVIGSLAAPPAMLLGATPSYPAVGPLAHDFANLKRVAG